MAITLLLCTVTPLFSVSAGTDTAWDGSIAEQYESGTGVQNDPYIIKTAEQLAKLVNDTDTIGKYYKLSNDIVINNSLSDSPKNWYAATGDDATDIQFGGILDGDGHTVSGLYFSAEGKNNAYYGSGLIPRAKNATVKNIGLINSSLNITGTGTNCFVASIIGRGNIVNVTGCFADETVTLNGNKGKAGGMVGVMTGASYILNCYFKGNLTATTKDPFYATGWTDYKNVKYSYTTSAVNRRNNTYYEFVYTTAINGGFTDNTFGNVYSVALADITGEKAKDNLTNFNFASIWATVEDSTPVLKAFLDEASDDEDDGDNTNAWSGEIADSYAAGDGSADNPFEIATAEQLARLVNDTDTAGKYYKLTSDIVINASLRNNPKQWYTVAVENGTDAVKGVVFKGNFNGNGHTVKGLYYDTTATDNTYWYAAGLFPRVDGNCSIQNVGVIGSSITVTGGGAAGSIIGVFSNSNSANQLNIRRCFADETVLISASNVGGIAGALNGETKVYDCYFKGTLSGSTNGIYSIGWNNSVNIHRYYTTSKITKKANEWFNDSVYSTTSNSCDECIKVTVAELTGKNASDTLAGFDFNEIWATVEDSTPILKVFLGKGGTAVRPEGIWTGAIAETYESGNGTEIDPYIIKTAEQLAKLVNDSDTKDKYYKLAADIYLNDISVVNWHEESGNLEWYSVNTDTSVHFNGCFDGDGYTVNGLYYGKTPGRDGYRSGLFPMIGSGAVIRNVGIVNSYLSAFGNVGAISGWSRNNGNGTAPVITGCYADETVTLKGMRVGGMVAAGSLIVSINNCYFTGKMEATENVMGAMTGYFWSSGITIANCYTVDYPIYRNDNNSSANYILKNCYSTIDQSGVTKLSKADMNGTVDKQKLVFAGFDFVSVWVPTDGNYPTLKVIPANYGIGAVGEVWSGNVAKDYANGDGTKNNPYLIETAAQLAKLIKDTDTIGKYYKLTADILLNDTTVADWHKNGKSTSSNVWYSVNDDNHTQFNGHFEGDGHIVSGIFYNHTAGKDGYRSGLFPMIGSGAVIRNVGVVNSYMSCYANVGAIVGWSNNKTNGEKVENPVNAVISGCYADDTVTIKGMRVGGIIGAGSISVDIDNCYFTGDLSATELESDGKTPIAAGIACYFWAPGNNIVNSYTVDYPLYRTGGNANFSIRDCYSNVEQANVKLRTKAEMTGDRAKINMPAFDWDTIWKTSTKTPVLIKVPVDYKANGYDGKTGELWSGQIATNYAGGDGTKNNPYLIATGEQLAKFVSGVIQAKPDLKGVYYKLIADIKLNDTSNTNWKDEARSWYFSTWSQYEKSMGFRGVFDGNGHTVSGVYLNVDNEGQVLGGLIPVIGEGGVVKNVGVINSYLRGYDHKHGNGWIGAVCGYAYSWEMPADRDGTGHMATISGCFADETVTVSGQQAGGILGATPRAILIENCYFTGTLLSETDGNKGGIVGYNWSGVIKSPIKNCYVATAAKDSAIGKCFDTTKCENVYCTVATVSGGRILSLKSMRGDSAIKYMEGFDFNNIWYACSDGTPVLRAFGTNSKYSNKSPFDKICITFITNGGNELQPIYGEEGTKIEWPTVTREGYEFDGWYVYRELDVKFPLQVFPMNDVTLYAKWKSLSIKQSFENDYDAEKMLGEDYEVYKLGVPGFKFDLVHDGLAAVHRIGKSNINSAFVLFDEKMGELIPGREYEITVWVYVEDGKSPVKLNLYQISEADISAKLQNKVKFAEIDQSKFGQWQEIKLNFVASEKYLAIESSGGSSIYFDDITIMPTGKTSEIDKQTSTDNNETDNSNNLPWIMVSVTAVVLVAAIVVACIFIKKRRNK